MAFVHVPSKYINQKPPLGSQINWNHSLSKGLVGCWLMNEGAGNKVNDLALKNNGIYYNPQWLCTKKGISANFNGTNSYIEILNNGDFNPNTSLSCFITVIFNSKDDNDSFIRTETTNNGWGLYRHSANDTVHTFIRINDAWVDIESSNTTTINTIHNFVMVWKSNGNLELYRDSLLVASASALGTHNAGENLVLAWNKTTNYFDCKIINLFIWKNRALSPSEIKDLYINPYQFIYKPHRTFYSIPTKSLSDYYDSNGWISCRVCQKAI